MSCYFIVQVVCRDREKRALYDKYIQMVKPIVERYGGTYLIRSEEIAVLDSARKPDRIILIRFPNRKQLDTCFHAPEYLKICNLRTSSVESHAMIVEGIEHEAM